MDKRFMGILAAIIVIFVVVLVVTQRGGNGGAKVNDKNLTHHVEGGGSTGVKLTEYGDYECPACGQYFKPVEQVFHKYHKRIYFQFRNFPLSSIHPNALAGARAAEAAGLQGQYFPMHDLLYQNQDSWSTAKNPASYFTNYARQLGLKQKKFKQDFKSSAVNAKIQADKAKGQKLNIKGTPAFFINGKKIKPPAPTVQAFSKLIDQAIQKKTGHKPKDSGAGAGQKPAKNAPKPTQTKVPQKDQDKKNSNHK
jgi:protein-disulfide isomerase